MYVCTYIYPCICVYICIYLPSSCVFSFQDSEEFILYVFISNTHSLPWYYHGNILSDYYLIRLTFFTAIVQWYKPIRQKECDILSLYVQISPLLPSFPINLPSDTDKPYFTGVETKRTAQDSPGNSNLSSPNPFPNHFLMYKSAQIELSNVILEISQTFQDLSIFHYFSLEHFFFFNFCSDSDRNKKDLNSSSMFSMSLLVPMSLAWTCITVLVPHYWAENTG